MNIDDFTSKVRRAIRDQVKEVPWSRTEQNSDEGVEEMTLRMFKSALKALDKAERESVLAEAALLTTETEPKEFEDVREQALWEHLKSEMMIWLRAVAPLFKVKV